MDNTDSSNIFFDNIVTEPTIITQLKSESQLESQTYLQPESVIQQQPDIIIQTETVIQQQTETDIIIQTEIDIQPQQVQAQAQEQAQPDIITETDIQQSQAQSIIQSLTNINISKKINVYTDIYSLENNINVFDSNVKNIYRPKYIWGPVIWNFIHTISIIDFLENKIYVNEVKNFLQSIVNILPCKKFSETYKIWIDKLETIDINERMVLFKWSVDLHNEVNIQLNKQTWTYEQAIERWCNKLPELPELPLL